MRKLFKLSQIFKVLAIAASFAYPHASSAQTVQNIKQSGIENKGGATLAEIQSRREILFRRMLDSPDDLDAAFEYAALSARAGDLEAAVSTLERMLIFSPGLPRLQLELGLLYYRLGAFDTATTYLEAAVSGPDVPQPVQQRVNTLLSNIGAAQERDVFTAQIRAGFRYQTNANRAPQDADVFLNGLRFVLNPDSVGEPDFNAYMAGTLHYAKDLESQGDTFEIDVVGYGAKQFERNELDLVQGEITIGPAFDLGRINIDNAKLGIYAIGSAVLLGGEFYGSAVGVGSRLAAQPNPKTSVLVKAEYRRRFYENTTNAPRATDRDGDEFRAGIYGSQVITPNLLMNVGVQGQRTATNRGYLDYSEVSVWAGPSIAFKSPVNQEAEKPWIASFAAGVTFRRYDEPDPIINVAESQSDHEIFGRGSLTVPLQEGWSFLAETEYRHVDSNYDTREHDNFSATLSVVKKW